MCVDAMCMCVLYLCVCTSLYVCVCVSVSLLEPVYGDVDVGVDGCACA